MLDGVDFGWSEFFRYMCCHALLLLVCNNVSLGDTVYAKGGGGKKTTEITL